MTNSKSSQAVHMLKEMFSKKNPLRVPRKDLRNIQSKGNPGLNKLINRKFIISD